MTRKHGRSFAESPRHETLLPLEKLSYSLNYDQTQILLVTLCVGAKTLAETEVLRSPFGSTLLAVPYPESGKTYCASFPMRDRVTRRLVLAHVLPMPRYVREK